MPKKVSKSTLPSLTEAQVKELALGIFRNEIFTDRHVAPHDQRLMATIFMPLGLMGKKDILALQRKQRPGMLYAKMSEAGPRSINGYPMFFSLSMVSEADAKKVWDEYKRLVDVAGHDAHNVTTTP